MAREKMSRGIEHQLSHTVTDETSFYKANDLGIENLTISDDGVD
jgi:hypothetical protein